MKIDWKAYFDEFCLVHGSNPVLYRRKKDFPRKTGMLLFPDGWMYSATSKKGPEYPPPTDPKDHLRLIRVYWSLKKRIVSEEYRSLKESFLDLLRTQQGCSAPLAIPQLTSQVEDNGAVRKRKVVETVDFNTMLNRLEDLSEQIRACQEQLENPTIPQPIVLDFSPASLIAQLESIETRRNTG